MAFKTKIQQIQRKNSEQWYIFFPAALARALEFEKSEEVEMVINTKGEVVLKRPSRDSKSGKKKND